MKQENESLIGPEVGGDMVVVRHHHRDGTGDTHELVPHTAVRGGQKALIKVTGSIPQAWTALREVLRAMGWDNHIKPAEKV